MISLKPINKETYNSEYLTKIAEWRNKSLISLRTNYITDPKKQKKWVDKFDASVRYFYIFWNGTLVGYCGLDKIDHTNDTAEMGLLIDPDCQRNKIGFTASQMLLQHGFYQINLNCIFIEVYETTSNWKFWERCGFMKEGLLKSRKKWKDHYYGSIIASITKSQFPRLQA